METSDNFSPKKRAAILSLAIGSTQQEAAKSAGVSEGTIVRWAKDSGIQSEIRLQQGQIYSVAIGQLVAACNTAAQALAEIAGSKLAKDTARVAAASKILEIVRDKVELAGLEQRLEALEQCAKN